MITVTPSSIEKTVAVGDTKIVELNVQSTDTSYLVELESPVPQLVLSSDNGLTWSQSVELGNMTDETRVIKAKIFSAIPISVVDNIVVNWEEPVPEPQWHAINSNYEALYLTSDIGPDGNIYVGGSFSDINGVAGTSNLARYNPSTDTWSALGTGLNDICRSLKWNNGELYIGGSFTEANGAPVNRIVKWTPTSGTEGTWSTLGTGLNGSCQSIEAVGNYLYTGGEFSSAGDTANTHGIARWNIITSTWEAMGVGLRNQVGDPAGYTLSVLWDGGANVYVGGFFHAAGNVYLARGIARWNITNKSWHAMGWGFDSGTVRTMVMAGTQLYVGGNFGSTGSTTVVNVARWNPSASQWSSLGSGTSNGVSIQCNSLVWFNDELYAGGRFTRAGGHDDALRAAKFTPPSTWNKLGTGLNGDCNRLFVYNDDIYAVGNFTTAGDIPAGGVARWGL